MEAAAESATAARLQRLLEAVNAKSAELVSHLHPAWVDAAWKHAGPAAAQQARHVPPRRQSALLAELYDLRWPALGDLAPRAHRLVVLGRHQILQILALCALYPRRERVRRSIGRDVHRLLAEQLGETAYRQLLDSPSLGGASQRPLVVQDLDPERMASAGYRALCTEGAWTCRSALALTRMSLSPSALNAAERAAATKSPARLVGTENVLDRLPDFFPEHTWLFGSDMDRALSA
jgi:hypothetical protein